jgi:hypothetical protein
MYNRKKLDRERLEIYLTQLLMMYRLVVFAVGLIVFSYGLIVLIRSTFAGALVAIFGLYLMLAGSSFWMITKTVKFLTWMALVGKKEE